MPEGALIVLTLFLGLAAGLLIGVATYATELRRLARSLRERDPLSNARLSLNAAPPALSELVEAINGELDRSAQARVGAQREQREFQRDLSAISHDIRTPLMGAKGYLQLALDEADPAMRAQRLVAAAERIDGTGALLDQLFSYTKASDPDLELAQERVELRPLVEQVLLGHYPEFEERSWEPELSCESPAPVVTADREALTRILENLVSNALRHGNGAPVIELGGADAGKNLLVISNPVADPSAIDAGRLFERFYRADSSRGRGGTGLGLATSAKLAQAMGLVLSARVAGGSLVIELRRLSGGDTR